MPSCKPAPLFKKEIPKRLFHVDMYVMIFYFFQFAKEEAKTKLNKLIFLNKNLYIALDFLLLIFIFHKHNKLHSFTRHSTVDKTQRLMGQLWLRIYPQHVCGYENTLISLFSVDCINCALNLITRCLLQSKFFLFCCMEISPKCLNYGYF